MGPRAGLDRCGKSHPPPGFYPETFKLLACLYTDYATQPTGKHVVPQNLPEVLLKDIVAYTSNRALTYVSW